MLLLDGHTHPPQQKDTIFHTLFDGMDYEHIHLLSKTIGYYDYDGNNDGDDFLPIAQLMQQHDTLIFLTPVYWYSMSGVMKVFFDRFSDLITNHKSIGRSLAGKRAYLIVAGHAEEIPPGFDSAFLLTLKYFDIDYGGYFYYSTEQTRLNDPALSDQARRFRENLHR